MPAKIPFIFGILFVAVFLPSSKIQAQLVNIESKRMHTDSIRFVLTGDLLFNYTKNNEDYILQNSANVTTQFTSRNTKSLYFLIGDYNLIKSQERDFQNSWFFHIRYNRKLSERLYFEGFIQNQNNTRLTVTTRNLIGSGLRWRLFASENTKSYVGNSYMYEIESIDATSQKFYNHRNSSYISLNQSFKKLALDLTGTLYFQPLYRSLQNHRILGQCKAKIPLTKRISFSVLYNYSYTSFSSVELDDDQFSNVNLGFTLSI